MEENNVVQSDVVNDTVGNQEQQSQEKAIVFPDEKSFMDRVKREAKKLNSDFVKSLGFESDNQLKELVEKQRQFEESQKTEYEKLQEALQQKEKYIEQVNQNLKLAEIKTQVLNAGIKQERLNYALKLIDINAIEFNEGKVNEEQLNSQISNLLNDFPELKGNQQIKSGGQDFSKSSPPDLLTMEVIKNMSPAEMEKRMDEVLKFLEKK
jgi:hypothetical protein